MDNLLTDEVIKRRLLVDGDGVGDDRRILALMKNYVQFCTRAKKDLDPEELAAGHRRLLSQLHQILISLSRNYEMIRVNEGTREMFVELGCSIRHEIEATKGHITDYKELLEDATINRKHAMEYDALGRLIITQPDRKEQEAKRDELLSELRTLKAKEANLTHKLNARRQNITMLAVSVERLKDLLRDEEDIPMVVEAPLLALPAPPISKGGGDDSVVDCMDVDVHVDLRPMSPDTLMELDSVPSKSEEHKKSPKAKSDKLHEDLSESDGEQVEGV